uniref:alpha-N-acetylglucosaminidase n=1 Tax=Saccharothrix mutabilis TaxID=33921 RepID=UPI0031DF791B
MFRTFVVSALVAGLLSTPPATAQPAAFDTAPAAAVLSRLLPAHASQFTLQATTGRDEYAVSGTSGAITVRGTSPATLLAGVGWYLRTVAGVDIGLVGDSLNRLPATLPAVTATTRTAVVPHRYALNDTQDGYAGAYRDFAALQREVDVLALNGYNEVYVQVGAEFPYYQAFQRFGYTAAELRAWIPAPAHQPWWLLQNLSGFGGPVSEQLITARADLGARLTGYLRGLGMTPVLPGYFGTVPTDFAARNPGASVVQQGTWVGFQRPAWLDPTNALFARVASAYYAAQKARFGSSAIYKMDLLHEGGNAGTVDVPRAARAVQDALRAAHPGAIWAILGWQGNPSSTLLSGVDKSGMLIVDGLSDRYDDLDRETSWGGTPYAFGAIPNFGGHTTIGANTAVWTSRFRQWLAKPAGALRGIAYLPESATVDPAAFALFSDLAWTTTLDHASWFADYATRRYGGRDDNATAAWDSLRRGPYSTPSGTWSESQDSLFAARPALTVRTAATWSPEAMRYDPETVRTALTRLLAVAPALRASDAYRYDVVDLARQTLANRSRALLPLVNAAYTAKDPARFRELADQWNREIALLDRLVGSDPRFLLGRWTASARAWGATPAEQDRLEYDQRSILSTWGHRAGSEGGGLHDYANREWSGLVAGLYAQRWSKFFGVLDTALATGAAPAAVDWFALEDAWARRTDPLPTSPSGDPVALAGEVAALPPLAKSGPITGVGGKCVDVTNGGSADGTPLQLYTCNGTPAQTWTASGGTLQALGKCMDARNGGTAPGTAVQLHSCNGTPAQSWTHQSDGSLRNAKSGLCLDATGGSSANGTGLILWTCHGGANQVWRLPA